MLTELTDGKVHSLKTLNKEYGCKIVLDITPWGCAFFDTDKGYEDLFTAIEREFCCGIRDIGHFTETEDPIFRHVMKKWMQAADQGILHVATDVDGSEVSQSLEYLGWEKVTSFVNTNSGNAVNVYHFYKPL